MMREDPACPSSNNQSIESKTSVLQPMQLTSYYSTTSTQTYVDLRKIKWLLCGQAEMRGSNNAK